MTTASSTASSTDPSTASSTDPSRAPARPTAASLYDAAGERRAERRAALVAAAGVPVLALGITALVLRAEAVGYPLTVLGLFLLVLGLMLYAVSDGAAAAETRRRYAAELKAHYGVGEIDATSLPVGVGGRGTLTVSHGGQYVTVTATIPSVESPVVLLGVGGRELPAPPYGGSEMGGGVPPTPAPALW